MEWSPVAERDLTVAEAKRADEVFITSSMRDVQGIERWDDLIFSPERPITEAVATGFAERSQAELDP
jgi:branched-chain amino acid aminotransferase